MKYNNCTVLNIATPVFVLYLILMIESSEVYKWSEKRFLTQLSLLFRLDIVNIVQTLKNFMFIWHGLLSQNYIYVTSLFQINKIWNNKGFVFLFNLEVHSLLNKTMIILFLTPRWQIWNISSLSVVYGLKISYLMPEKTWNTLNIFLTSDSESY